MKFILSLILLQCIITNKVESRESLCNYKEERSSFAWYSYGCELRSTDETFLRAVNRDEWISNLIAKNSSLSDVPKIIPLLFTKLETLFFDGCSLKNLNNESFAQKYPKLERLKVSKSEFNALFDEMFADLNLSKLVLIDGQLENIPLKAFNGLAGLRVLNMSGNKIKSLVVGVFDALVKLVQIDISKNQLTIVPGELFKNSLELSKVNFDFNQITSIDDNFMPQKDIEEFFLGYNNLTKPPKILERTKIFSICDNKIKYFHLSNIMESAYMPNNEITNFTCDPQTLKILRLNVSENNLETFPECIKNATVMYELDLSYNNIGKINSNTFASFSELKILKLAHTNLSGLDFGTFSHNHKLNTLDLSFNNLGKFSDSLVFSPELHVLHLDGNNLTEIPLIGSLQVLTIGDNNFNCSHLSKASKKYHYKVIQTLASKIIDTKNFKGIGCNDLADIEAIVDDDTQRKIESLLNSQLAIQKSIQQLVDDLKEIPAPTQNNIVDTLTSAIQNLTQQQEHPNQSQVNSIRNLLILILVAVVLFLCYKAYRKYRTEVPMRRLGSNTNFNSSFIEFANRPMVESSY